MAASHRDQLSFLPPRCMASFSLLYVTTLFADVANFIKCFKYRVVFTSFYIENSAICIMCCIAASCVSTFAPLERALTIYFQSGSILRALTWSHGPYEVIIASALLVSPLRKMLC